MVIGESSYARRALAHVRERSAGARIDPDLRVSLHLHPDRVNEGRTVLGLLDDYIESHTHGVIDLARDAEALVLDPCCRGTPIEDQAHALGVPSEWHAQVRGAGRHAGRCRG